MTYKEELRSTFKEFYSLIDDETAKKRTIDKMEELENENSQRTTRTRVH